MGFRALVVERDDAGVTSASVQALELSDLPEGEVTVAVEYSTLNYKDGLSMGSGGGLVRKYPHVPGVDFAGVVSASSNKRYAVGDKVICTGWRVGEAHWGGYAEFARVRADWLVPLPLGQDTRWAMALGTAGLTAMLAVQALETHGLVPGHGPVLVTGASGGVGSVAVALLARLGHEVVAVSGRDAGYLLGLGASRVLARSELAEVSARKLESETWAGCVDAVGGAMLARLLGQMKYRTSVAAVGLAGASDLPASVVPFILRGVNLLGIESVMEPYPSRVIAWERLAREMPMSVLEAMVVAAELEDLPRLGREILTGQVRGRVVVAVGG